jgi:uncharacterized membrane protein
MRYVATWLQSNGIRENNIAFVAAALVFGSLSLFWDKFILAMIRKYLPGLPKADKEKIKWRSHEVTRIEALSDAVFAFGISLLIISLEVPKNSHELMEALRGLVPFFLSCILIFWVWRAQYKFFRRYGLHDDLTITLNAILLFVLLGYVYPLKFMFSVVFLPGYTIVDMHDYALLLVLYNGGCALFSILFCAMYFNAARLGSHIKLTPIEHFDTIDHACYFAIPAIAATLAAVLAWLLRDTDGNRINICYDAYILIGVAMPLFGRYRKRVFHKRFGDVPETEPHHGTEA